MLDHLLFFFFFFKLDLGTGEIAQQLRASAILLEEPNSFSRTYLRWLTTTYNSSSRYPQSHAHTHAWAYACTYNNFKRLHLVFFFFCSCTRHLLVFNGRSPFLPWDDLGGHSHVSSVRERVRQAHALLFLRLLFLD